MNLYITIGKAAYVTFFMLVFALISAAGNTPSVLNQKCRGIDQVMMSRGNSELDLLYLIVTDSDAETVPSNTVVLLADAALELARQYSSHPKPFNIVFLIRRDRKMNFGMVTGFSLDQLKEIVTAEEKEAKSLARRHAWTIGSIPSSSTKPQQRD